MWIITQIRQVAMVILIWFSQLPICFSWLLTSCLRLPICWVWQVCDFPDHAHDLITPDSIWCQIMPTVTTNMTMFYSLKLSYWLPNHWRSFRNCTDFQDVCTILPQLHVPTLPFSTIFQITEIGTSRSAQCDLGLRLWCLNMEHCYWPFVRGIHQSLVNFHHEGREHWHFHTSLNMLLNKRSRCWWFEMPWYACDVTVMENWELSWCQLCVITGSIRDNSNDDKAGIMKTLGFWQWCQNLTQQLSKHALMAHNWDGIGSMLAVSAWFQISYQFITESLDFTTGCFVVFNLRIMWVCPIKYMAFVLFCCVSVIMI